MEKTRLIEEFFIWSDNELEAEWFASLDSRLASSTVQIIQNRGNNIQIIEELVAYDRPDIILLDKDGIPVLVLEKTREVPTGHNVGQRVARLVRAAEFGLSTFFFLPFDARKHGTFSSMCTINVRLLRAMLRIGEIHNCDVLPVNWPCDSDGELIVDGSENLKLSALISSVLDMRIGKPNDLLEAYEQEVLRELEFRESAYPPYRGLPKSVKFEVTSSFLSRLGFLADESAKDLLRRKESLIYMMNMTPDKCRRQDPYTGMQFIYDYTWLREGPSPRDRKQNLILHFPLVDKKTWIRKNPEDYKTKSCNWYLTADAIVLSDGIIRIKKWPLHHDN